MCFYIFYDRLVRFDNRSEENLLKTRLVGTALMTESRLTMCQRGEACNHGLIPMCLFQHASHIRRSPSLRKLVSIPGLLHMEQLFVITVV